MTGGRQTLAIAAVILVAVVATSAALRSAPPVFAQGDHAVLELYTLNALASPWPFGPYSRYKWHHPGPLFFYWEAPWYLASGRHTLGMHTGALALSVASLGALLALLVQARAADREPVHRTRLRSPRAEARHALDRLLEPDRGRAARARRC